MGRGEGYKTGGGREGACEVLPLRKRGVGGGGKVSAMLKGGGGRGTKSFEVVLTRELEVLAIVMEAQIASIQFYPVGRGGGTKCLGPAIFPFSTPPPLPVINDQSLKDRFSPLTHHTTIHRHLPQSVF